MDKQYTVFTIGQIHQMWVEVLLLNAGVNPSHVKFDTIAAVPQGIMHFTDCFEDAKPETRRAFVRVVNVPEDLADVQFDADPRFEQASVAERITFEVFQMLRDEFAPQDDDGTEIVRAIGAPLTLEVIDANLRAMAPSFPQALAWRAMRPGLGDYSVAGADRFVNGQYVHTNYVVNGRKVGDEIDRIDLQHYSEERLAKHQADTDQLVEQCPDTAKDYVLPHVTIRDHLDRLYVVYNNQGNYLFGCLTVKAQQDYLREVLDGFFPSKFKLDTLAHLNLMNM